MPQNGKWDTELLHYLQRNDIVFLSHGGYGLIAAGRVVTGTARQADEYERNVEVTWLTTIPQKENGIQNYLPFAEITRLLGHGFFWSRTIKTPYLTSRESHILLNELKQKTG